MKIKLKILKIKIKIKMSGWVLGYIVILWKCRGPVEFGLDSLS